MTIADALTCLRLGLVPAFLAAVVLHHPLVALAVFSVAGLTDLIDGSVARWIDRKTTERGAILDPIADKLLLGTSFISLAILGVIPLWFLIVALARDLMIMMGIIYFKRGNAPLPFRPVWSSKFGTLSQLGLSFLGFLRWGGWSGWQGEEYLFTFFLAVATGLILVSAVQYVWRAWDVLALRRAS